MQIRKQSSVNNVATSKILTSLVNINNFVPIRNRIVSPYLFINACIIKGTNNVRTINFILITF